MVAFGLGKWQVFLSSGGPGIFHALVRRPEVLSPQEKGLQLELWPGHLIALLFPAGSDRSSEWAGRDPLFLILSFLSLGDRRREGKPNKHSGQGN